MTALSNFSFPTSICFGAGAISELPGHLSVKGIKKPLFVSDPVLAKLAIVKESIQAIDREGAEAILFCDIAKNPVKSNVMSGVEIYKLNDCDGIIGFGGGASLDVARAIALKVNHERDLFDYDDSSDGWKYVTDNIPYFIAVPTTSGTGSEVGRSSVISDDETHQKQILFAPRQCTCATLKTGWLNI